MAKQIPVNRGMVDALKRMLRLERCKNCSQTIDFHSWITINNKKEVVSCSNNPQ